MRSSKSQRQLTDPGYLPDLIDSEIIERVSLLRHGGYWKPWQGSSFTMKELCRRGARGLPVIAQLILLGWLTPEDAAKYKYE